MAGNDQIAIFELDGKEWGIGTDQVQEVIGMVEIKDPIQARDFVRGMINLRGSIVPLLDLRGMLGLRDKGYQPSDNIIIGKIQDKLIGIPVDRVSDVLSVDIEGIGSALEGIPLERFLSGMARLGERLIFVLDLVALWKAAGVVKKGKRRAALKQDDAKGILHERAMSLSKRIEEEEKAERLQVINFLLAGEWYGLDLKWVQEIIGSSEVIRIPQTPDCVAGVINLRGEICWIIDTKRLLGLPSDSSEGQVIMVKAEGIGAGLLVDRVEEIITLPLEAIEPPLATVEKPKAEYIEGEVQLDDRLLVMLNLKNIISSGEIRVDGGELG